MSIESVVLNKRLDTPIRITKSITQACIPEKFIIFWRSHNLYTQVINAKLLIKIQNKHHIFLKHLCNRSQEYFNIFMAIEFQRMGNHFFMNEK